ncbi:hypothetical protein BS78_03G096600 [Paspalum vaginatum]|nr:hypothetical protein BS78_03G096600 [Paspalum vaginatum]
MEGSTTAQVQVMSRRVVLPEPPPPPPTEEVHLTPWDLQMLALGYIQSGLLLPKPNLEPGVVVDRLASAFARALGLFYPFAGRLVVGKRGAGDGSTATTMSLRCTGEGVEFVHAAAPGVTAADITAGAPRYIPRELVASLFPPGGLLSFDAASPESDEGSRRAPVLAAQVTELADGVFVAVSLNHGVGDGTTFWHFVNTWSELARGDASERPPPVLKRWFPENFNCPVPVPLQLAKVEHIRRRGQPPPPPALQECAFHFSPESVKKLKARANAQAPHSGAATVSSLQALLAHLWRSVCRARLLEPSQQTTYLLVVGCRGRVKGVPQTGYVGNAVVACMVTSTAGEVLEKGLGWASSLLNSAVAKTLDEAAFRDWLERWTREPRFTPAAVAPGAAAIFVGSSPRFDVYGNDFGWGKPVAVRSGPGNKVDGKATVYEGRGGDGAIYPEVCLAPDALARLVADEEFMDAVTAPPQL